MKQKNILLVLLLCVNCFSMISAQTGLRLFHIERNKDADIICYDLIVKDNVIDTEMPVHVYWDRITQDDKLDELNKIQKSLAYGVDVDKISDNEVSFILKAYKERMVTAVYNQESNTAYAQLLIDGKQARLNKIYFYAVGPLYESVVYVELHGKDIETGKKLYEKIENKN
ncbi:DUF4833 domain-containing protein [Paludibacteraceae bacterium OttesenSCG-928-F17]|nr:DUF4833 domain-containing protein [Paludibacteraceae bacterium OttesenSCG-928-F17]